MLVNWVVETGDGTVDKADHSAARDAVHNYRFGVPGREIMGFSVPSQTFPFPLSTYLVMSMLSRSSVTSSKLPS